MIHYRVTENKDSKGINRNKVTLKRLEGCNESLMFSIESLNRSVLIESIDFVCSGSCMETYSLNGYLNTCKGVLLDGDLNYPSKTFILLNSFDQPLNKLYVKVC